MNQPTIIPANDADTESPAVSDKASITLTVTWRSENSETVYVSAATRDAIMANWERTHSHGNPYLRDTGNSIPDDAITFPTLDYEGRPLGMMMLRLYDVLAIT